MPARSAPAYSAQRQQRELADLQLVVRARNGDQVALDALMRRYTGFVRLKASSYFLAGGDSEDLIQEGLIGLYKAVRDFRHDKETSFRSFAELCVTRQIITAIKTATRFKHSPLNTYISFSNTPAGQDSDSDVTLGDAPPSPRDDRDGPRPRTRQQLDGVESNRDQQVRLVDDVTFDLAVGEDAGKERVDVRHDAFRFVGDHRGNATARAERAERGRVVDAASAEACDDERTDRAHRLNSSRWTGPAGSATARAIASRITSSTLSVEIDADHFVTEESNAR